LASGATLVNRSLPGRWSKALLDEELVRPAAQRHHSIGVAARVAKLPNCAISDAPPPR